MTIKPITQKEINEVVRVHNSAFQNFFLTSLGPKFLNLYYSSFLKSNQGIMAGAYLDDKLIGFAATCKKSSGFNSSLIKENLLKFSFVSLGLMFTRPKALIRLLKNFTKRDNIEVDGIVDEGQYAELMSIAVSKDVQNTGVGKQLVEYTENKLREEGISSLSLTTDQKENENTLAFYKKRGFEKMYDFTSYPDRKMVRLIKNLI